MNTKLFLQVLLLLGCVCLAIALLQVLTHQAWYFTARGWWEGAMACWLLVIAVRVVYPDRAK
jgi:hypothetical protein